MTGAVRRIGRAIALALAGDGAAVVINARSSRAEAAAVAAEIEAQRRPGAGPPGRRHRRGRGRRPWSRRRSTRFGRLDILVNNAADRQQTPLTEISLAEWRHITGIIVDGAFLCARACLPPMIAGGGGTIVNIGGVSAHIGARNRAHVITAKAALVGLTKAIAVEFAGRGITANCVVPGKIGGERSRTAGEAPAIGGGAAPIVGRAARPRRSRRWCITSACRPAATSPARRSTSAAACTCPEPLSLQQRPQRAHRGSRSIPRIAATSARARSAPSTGASRSSAFASTSSRAIGLSGVPRTARAWWLSRAPSRSAISTIAWRGGSAG